MSPREAALLSLEIPDLDRKIRVLSKILPGAFDRGLKAGILAATIDVSGHIKDLLTGEVLNRRSGRLWKSIQPEVFRRFGRIVGIVGTDVEYAAIHEFGGTIRPKSENGWLRFQVAGQFRTVREVEMPRRPFMSRGFRERKDRMGQLISQYVLKEMDQAVTGGLRGGGSGNGS